jgi:HEAT repeat protein
MSHIFISYARKEGCIAEKLEAELQQAGFETYRDEHHTTPSCGFHTEVKQNIEKASHFIVFITEGTDQRPEKIELLEIAYALAEDQKRQHNDPPQRLPIIPLVFPGGVIPPIIQSWEPSHVNGDLVQENMEKLIDRLNLSHHNPGQNIPSRLKTHLKSLCNVDVDRRCRAAEDLGQIGDPVAIPALTYAFKDVNKTARCPDEVDLVPLTASNALIKIGTLTIPSLLVALRDEGRGAAGTLKDLGTPSIPGLLNALDNGGQTARFGSAWALGWIKDSSAVPGLLEALNDPEQTVQIKAIKALGIIGHSSAVPGLLKVLRDTKINYDVRYNAAMALGMIKDPSAVPDLIAILQNKLENQWVQRFSATALGRIGDSRAIEILISSSKNGYNELRASAVSALGNFRDPFVITILVEALNDPIKEVAWYSARSLGKIGDPAAVPGLLNALINRRHLVRKHAAKSLGMIGDATSVPGLCKALWDRDRFVRYSAAEALGQIGDLAAVPKLCRVLWHYDSSTRRVARKALYKILAK